MRAPSLLLVTAAIAACAGACASSGGSSDGDDDDSAGDATSADAAPLAPDAAAASDAADAAPIDAALGLPLPGFGALGGDCDVLDDELEDPAPSLFESAIAFDRLYEDADLDSLTAGGQEIIRDGNAGGSSLLSEVFAFELLARCERAPLLKTETEIVYDTAGTITDLLVSIDRQKIGVSVTRAVGFPFDDPYTVDQARDLLERKLADILESSANVSAEDRWEKQILAVLAFAPEHAASIEAALDAIDPAVKADTIVWVLVTDGADDFIYCDGPCT